MNQKASLSKPKTLREKQQEAAWLIEALGGVTNAAEAMGVTKGRVSQMKDEGVPSQRLALLHGTHPHLFWSSGDVRAPVGHNPNLQLVTSQSSPMRVNAGCGVTFHADYETNVQIDGNRVVVTQVRDGVSHIISCSPDRALDLAEALQTTVDEYSTAYSALVDKEIYGGN